ncbi:MAG: type II toxin-antitoxin system VapC family toxin [Proteobacteria bacterium]|nr:type II toxin-antitoxin system VapC family toxin [Pseudomonadota bacterium]
MLLVDTSIWSDHLRRGDAALARRLEAGEVLVHALVIGEIACGAFPRRPEALALLTQLPAAPVLGLAELLDFIDRQSLQGKGIGFVDVHLLAAARVSGAALWTRDKRLAAAAAALGCLHTSAS